MTSPVDKPYPDYAAFCLIVHPNVNIFHVQYSRPVAAGAHAQINARLGNFVPSPLPRDPPCGQRPAEGLPINDGVAEHDGNLFSIV